VGFAARRPVIGSNDDALGWAKNMDRHAHWDGVYGARQPTELSWYAAHLTRSVALIREVSTGESSVIDVGGGASTLVDELLGAGYRRVAVLDIAGSALALARERLGPLADRVTWIEGDVTSVALPDASYDVWHDRAVFHFLIDASDRLRYVHSLKRALKVGGHLVIGTFSLSGPEKCSGLEVARYDAVGLQREFGEEFSLTVSEEQVHVTPNGKQQAFVLCRFKRLRSAAG
jgi:SAM-dependent methyltransferase